MTDYRDLPLENQVAQLFMLGYGGNDPQSMKRFLELGLGGVIFFRNNFEALPDAAAVHHLLDTINQAIPAQLPRPLLGIDQEGGQVERLPHTLFPTALTPRAVACAPDPAALAKDMYAGMARYLRALGFNLDFFPTLDVNLNPQNPIIGVRSFADDPETVWQLSEIAMREFEQAGLITVGKHFPGHGNGTVDSHLDLPTLTFTEAELQPFRQAVEAGIPAMLVAHGYYPALQTASEDQALPSSASPAIIQGLLREQLGFEGVLITDDMCMGAITRNRGPVQAALASLCAGVDILLYKQSTDAEWAVYQAALAAFRNGDLPMEQLHRSLARIQQMKTRLAQQAVLPFNPADFTSEASARQAERWAMQGIGLRSGQLGPLNPETPLLLVHPQREKMGNYAFDMPSSPELDAIFQEAGFSRLQSVTYPVAEAFSADALLAPVQTEPQTIVVVTFNPRLRPAQQALIRALAQRFPQARRVIVSAGMPDGLEGPKPDTHLSLCSYRPASMQALVKTLRLGRLSVETQSAGASSIQ